MPEKTSKHATRAISLMLLLVTVLSCGYQRAGPSDALIWKGYAAVVRSPQDSQASDHSIIEQAMRTLTIERLGRSELTVPNPRLAKNPPVPEQLYHGSQPVTGEVVDIRIVSKANRKQIILLRFVRWHGMDDWWVSQVGPHPWQLIEADS